MKFIYEEYGVEAEEICPECREKMILFHELNIKYLVCTNLNCRFIKIIDKSITSDKNKQQREAQYLFILALFNLEAIARESDIGDVNKIIWEHIMRLEADSINIKISNELLDKFWNTNLVKSMLKSIQIEKLKSNNN